MIGIVASSAGGAAAPQAGIVNFANTTVGDQGGGVYRVTKTGGVNLDYDASAVSTIGLSGDCLVRLTPLLPNKGFLFGLTGDPNANASYDTIDRAIYCESTGSIGGFFQNGAQVGGGEGSYVGTTLFVRRVGTAITALRGPTNNVADASIIHTFDDQSGGLYFDCSINGAGCAFDVQAVAL